MISLCKPTGSNCLIPPPKRDPIPAAMISNIVFFILFFLFCLIQSTKFWCHPSLTGLYFSLAPVNILYPYFLMTGTIIKISFHFSLFQLLQNLPLHSCHQLLQHTLHFCFLFFQLGELFFHSLQLRLLCFQFLSDACNVFFQGSYVGDKSRLPSHKEYNFVDFIKFLANFHLAFPLFIPCSSCLTPSAPHVLHL